jgi:CRP-like cAMP-binding protein
MSQSSYDFLTRLELFRGMPPDQFSEILRALRPQSYQAGEVIFRQGDEGFAAFVVQSGAVEIFITDGPRSTTVHRYTAGEVFGELALIDGSPRSAGARALVPCELLCLDKREFDALRAALRPAAFHVLRVLSAALCTRIRETNDQIEAMVVHGRQEVRGAPVVVSARISEAPAEEEGLWARLTGLFKR